eukprot:m.13996 g.13996  ORF g.13996 m.13996 type:complete len:314 (-) comp7015_c0_seq1:745-1686(-)
MNDYFNGSPLPACPEGSSLSSELEYAATWGLFVLLLLISVTLAAVVQNKYNSIVVFNRRVRPSPVSNTFWLAFFVCNALRACFGILRYVYTVERDDSLDAAIFIVEAVFQGLTKMWLSLTLNYQRRFRSANVIAARPSLNNDPSETAPLLNQRGEENQASYFMMSSMDYVIVLQMIVCISFLFGQMDAAESSAFFWVYSADMWTEYALQLYLMATVFRQPSDYGPSRLAKFYLGSGMALSALNVLPPTVWQHFLPDNCVFYVAGWVDLILLLSFCALLFFFLFLRLEFYRNRDPCIFTAVNRLKDSIKFRNFR